MAFLASLLTVFLWYMIIGIILLLVVSFVNLSWIRAANEYCNDYAASKKPNFNEKEFKLSFIIALIIVFSFLWPLIVPTLFHD